MTVQLVLYTHQRQLIASMVLLQDSYIKKDVHDEAKIKNVCVTNMRLRKRLEAKAKACPLPQPYIAESRNQANDI